MFWDIIAHPSEEFFLICPNRLNVMQLSFIFICFGIMSNKAGNVDVKTSCHNAVMRNELDFCWRYIARQGGVCAMA